MIECLITAIVSVVTGIGGTLLFFPQIRKSKMLENEAKQSEEWHKLYIEEKEQREADRQRWIAEREELQGKVDHFIDRVSEVRKENVDMLKTNTQLEVENTRLCMLKCEVPVCPNRKPPTGF